MIRILPFHVHRSLGPITLFLRMANVPPVLKDSLPPHSLPPATAGNVTCAVVTEASALICGGDGRERENILSFSTTTIAS